MRMRKTGWTVLGLVGLSLLVCGSAEAQTADAGASPDATLRSGEPPTQPSLEENRGAASPNTQAVGTEADLKRTVTRLQWEVAQLRADVAELRARLAEQQAVGGAGEAGQAGTGGGGQAGAATPGTQARGNSQATASYVGTVEAVGPQSIVIDASGTPLTLDVNRDTRVFRADGRRMNVQQLQTGSRVNVTVDLLTPGRTEADEITVLPTR